MNSYCIYLYMLHLIIFISIYYCKAHDNTITVIYALYKCIIIIIMIYPIKSVKIICCVFNGTQCSLFMLWGHAAGRVSVPNTKLECQGQLRMQLMLHIYLNRNLNILGYFVIMPIWMQILKKFSTCFHLDSNTYSEYEYPKSGQQ